MVLVGGPKGAICRFLPATGSINLLERVLDVEATILAMVQRRSAVSKFPNKALFFIYAAVWVWVDVSGKGEEGFAIPLLLWIAMFPWCTLFQNIPHKRSILRGSSAYVYRMYQEPKLRTGLYSSSQPPGFYGIQPKRLLDAIEFQPCISEILYWCISWSDEGGSVLFEFFLVVIRTRSRLQYLEKDTRKNETTEK